MSGYAHKSSLCWYAIARCYARRFQDFDLSDPRLGFKALQFAADNPNLIHHATGKSYKLGKKDSAVYDAIELTRLAAPKLAVWRQLYEHACVIKLVERSGLELPNP